MGKGKQTASAAGWTGAIIVVVLMVLKLLNIFAPAWLHGLGIQLPHWLF